MPSTTPTGASGDDRGPNRAVDDAITRSVALAALAGIALIHILQVPEAFAEAGYLRGLFIAAVVAGVVLAALLTRTGDHRVIWGAGGLAALILAGYVVSRTSGLPGATDDVGEWTEPLGLTSMVVEALLVCVAAGVQPTRRETTARAMAGIRTRRTRDARSEPATG